MITTVESSSLHGQVPWVPLLVFATTIFALICLLTTWEEVTLLVIFELQLKAAVYVNGSLEFLS